MPTITANGLTFEAETTTRLAQALKNAGIRIGHRCGGNARCTTCRVTFAAGEPATYTEAEYAKLQERGGLGQYRLACQILCDHAMTVEALMTADNQPQWNGDTGPALAAEITPSPERKVVG